MKFRINTDAVVAELDKIDSCIDELRQILSGMESDISSGWDSARAAGLVTPKIEEVRSSIENMQACTNNVRSNVVQYVANVHNADEAGNISSAG